MEAPCGGVAAGGQRTSFEAGSTTTLAWRLTQNHNAEFRVAFSPTAEDQFEDWVLGSRPDVEGQFEYEQPITLPSCTCDQCAIQLLQYTSPTMLEAYYSCADIELTQPEGGDLPPCDEADGTTGGVPGTTGPSTTGSSTTGGTSTTTLGTSSTGANTSDSDAESSGSTAAIEEPTSGTSAGGGGGSDGGCRLGNRPPPVIWLAGVFVLLMLRTRD